MTGPEHYKKADELLREAWHQEPGHKQDNLAQAQVHATLALAAATAAANRLIDSEQVSAWTRVAG